MDFSFILRAGLAVILLFLSASLPTRADDISLLNTATREVQQQIAAVSPNFIADQKTVVRAKFPLFIFVPGIIGSRLERTTATGTNVLWGLYDLSTPDLSILDGDDDAIKPTILMDFKVADVATVDAYASGIDDLTKTQLGVDLLDYFPYDWRQDNARTAERLNSWLCDPQRNEQYKDREIRFIAHSMGGLVVKEWFRRYGGQPRCRVSGSGELQARPLAIKEVIFLGTPHFGAPKAIKSLASGFTLAAKDFGGMIGLLADKLDKGTVAKALNEFGSTFPSVYQLLPIYHEHAPDCMDSYAIQGDGWPPKIAVFQGSGDTFPFFNAKAWETLDWPESKPPALTRAQFYAFLTDTLPKARAFLCGLAQYKFPAGLKVRYFSTTSQKTDASFEIKKETSWFGWGSSKWVIEDVARAPWTDGDGTVPTFVARNELAVGFSRLEDPSDVDRTAICADAHSSLLNCRALRDYVRLIVLAAKRSQSEAADLYLNSHPAEKGPVLQALASANVYLSCPVLPSEVHRDASFTVCPVNDEIRQRSGVSSTKTLLAQVQAAPAADDKADKLEVVAAMQGLDPPARVEAAEGAAVAQAEVQKVNAARNTLVSLAGTPATEPDAFKPVQVADKIIVNTPISNRVVAVNLDGQPSVAWTHTASVDPSVIPAMCCEPTNTGRLAYADGKIIKYEADTTLVALDANTGQELWKTRTGDPLRGEVGDRTPYIIGDKVLVGVSGAEFGARDSVASLDLKTGKPQWQAYAKGSDTDILFNPQTTMAEGKPVGKDWSLKTWTGDQWRMSGGAQNSNTVIDPELKLIYYVASDSAPYQPQARKQASAHTLFARDLDTGEARWIYPLPAIDEPGDIELSLAEKDIKGEKRKVVDYRDMAGNLISLDRAKGELLESLKTKAWADAPEQFPRFDAMP